MTNLTPSEYGHKYWGEIGAEIFRRINFYIRSNMHFFFCAPFGFGKTIMLEEYFNNFIFNPKNFYTDYQFVEECTPEAFAGSTVESRGYIKDIVVPLVLKRKYTILPDFSAMLRGRQHDSSRFQGVLISLLDAQIHNKSVNITLVKSSGVITDKSKAHETMEEFADNNLRLERGTLSYDYNGVIIICLLKPFLDQMREDLISRFQPLVYTEEDMELVFNHILKNGFLERTRIPNIPKKWHHLIKRIFPKPLQTPREVVKFAKVLKNSASYYNKKTPNTDDLWYAMRNFYRGCKYQRVKSRIKYKDHVIYELVDICGVDMTHEILKVAKKTIQNVVSLVKKRKKLSGAFK